MDFGAIIEHKSVFTNLEKYYINTKVMMRLNSITTVALIPYWVLQLQRSHCLKRIL